ncbi:MAG: glycosyltransferase family 4 protein, partial [Planctomycetota bacterium]
HDRLDGVARSPCGVVEPIVIAWDDADERSLHTKGPELTVCRLDASAAWDTNAARLRDAIGPTPSAIVVHTADTPRLIAQHLGLGVPLIVVAHDDGETFAGWRSVWPWSGAAVPTDRARERVERHAGRRPVHTFAEIDADCAGPLQALLTHAQTTTERASLCAPSLERLPARSPRRSGRRKVVSLIAYEESPLGGVTMFSRRLADAFADRPDLGYDMHTLFVAWDASSTSRAAEMLGENATMCVLDRSKPMHDILDHLREAVELCEPDIVLPNYTDANAMVAAQLRHTGVRCVGIAHTDDDSYRELLLHSEWDGAVAVSESIRAWLGPLAGDRPCATITYSIPIADQPRTPSQSGPLQIAYFGRVVQPQKRIMDLVPVMQELDRLGVEARLHIVGDGAALGQLRRAFGQIELHRGAIEFHGERDADWVASFLPSVDVSILVSEAEGTSISMLEAMGVGVVPAVTRVSSGADEWVEPRISGVVAPIGDAEAMAAELAWLAEDRGRLSTIGAEAHRRVSATQSVAAMAQRYADMFDAVMARPMDRRPSVAGVTPIEPFRWASCDTSDRNVERDWTVRRLREAGFERIATQPGQIGDVVVQHAHPGPSAEVVAGVPVVRFGERPSRDGLVPHVERLAADGFRRIAIYGLGRHTQWRAGVFHRDDLPIVGIIDDTPPPSGEAFGLPVVTLDDAADRLRPDAVLLSSDAWEVPMRERARPLELTGVHVRGMYSEPSQAATVPASSIDA